MSNSRPVSPNRWRVILTIAGVAAFLGVLVLTSGHGPGLDPDSMAYVGAATSLSQGNGLRVPMGKWQSSDSTVELTLWPPAFSAAMAVPQSLGVAPLLSARLILAASAAATVVVTGMILGGALSLPAVIVALVVILVTPSFVTVQMSVLSEPLFIASLALVLFGLLRSRPGVASVGATLAVMTRYAGASAALGGAVWFFFFERGSWKRRTARAAISSAPAAIAFAAWMIHNSRVKVTQSTIAVGFFPGVAATAREGVGTLASWIAPGASATAAALVAGVGLLALVVVAVAPRREKAFRIAGSGWSRITAAAGVLLASYLAVLICSRVFVGGAIRFDARIMAPAIFLLESALLPFVFAAFAGRPRIVQTIGALAVAVWMIAAVSAQAPIVLDSIQDGNDLAASDWRESPTAEWITEKGGRYTIYSNWPAAVFFDAHRNAFDIPTSADPDTLARFGEILNARHGVLAAFNTQSPDFPPIDSIVAGAGLVKLDSVPDGVIWAPKQRAN